MFRTAILVAMLGSANVAFACGGTKTAAVDISEAPGTHVKIDVAGMTCGSCSDKVTTALKELKGVNAVTVDHATGKAEVAYDAKMVDEKLILDTITKLDFKASISAPVKG